VSAKRRNFNFSKLPDSWARVPRPTPPCTDFSNRCCPKIARKTVPSVVPRCPDWCGSVFLVWSQFPPFCTPGTRGQGDGHGAKPRPINAKKPRVNSGFRGKTLHFEAFCRSGEREIRTPGTLRYAGFQDRLGFDATVNPDKSCRHRL